MNNNSIKAVFTDLDGTLLNSDYKLSIRNLESLKFIKQNNALNICVTGRNLYSTKKVLTDNLPIDYLIYSTGIAISDFRTKQILKKFEIGKSITTQIIKLLLEFKLNFFIHKPAPDNHFFYYNYSFEDIDFVERFKLYADFSIPLKENINEFSASQFVIVMPFDLDYFKNIVNEIEKKFPFLSLIRATSPINHQHIWLEIYPPNVSKGNAVKLLCNKLEISTKEIVAIGNDYNDLDMLEIARKSYVVENAPEFLKNKFEIVYSNDKDGFSEAIEKLYKKNSH